VSRDHRNLEAFRLADQFVLDVYEITRHMPREELFGLTSQLRRAAVSTAANIVEGAARSSEREFVQSLNIAMGSLREAGYHLSLTVRLGMIDQPTARKAQDSYEQAARVLHGLIRSFKVRQSNPE
jgi:four helix bundle protein